METTKEELAADLMDKFSDFQRILRADDREKEILYQIKITREKLEEPGVVTENLILE